MFDSKTLDNYRALKDDVAKFPIDGSLVRLTGGDRLQFLHNFCTNEIKAMPANGVCEAFILDGKGKILFHVHVLNGQDALWLHSVAKDADQMIEHLDKYLLRDDVQMEKVVDRQNIFVTGPNAGSALQPLLSAALPENQLVELSDGTLVVHLELAGFGYLVIAANLSVVPETIVQCSSNAFHAVRIENRTPWLGIEIDNSNLPQELLRDEKAISFTKGCYLGQETVARIDAIGRVNRVIVLVESEQSIQSGDELVVAEKKVGTLLGVTWSPDQSRYLASAVVRRPHEKKRETENFLRLAFQSRWFSVRFKITFSSLHRPPRRPCQTDRWWYPDRRGSHRKLRLGASQFVFCQNVSR